MIDENEQRARILGWAKRAQTSITQFSYLLQPFFALPSPLNLETASVLGRLAMQCSLTSDSVLALVALDKLWDAEILIRSVQEGTLRFVHLCARDPVERESRRVEYSEYLPEIARVKQSQRAERLLEVIPKDWEHLKPIQDMVLSQSELERIRQRFPRDLRKKIEHKWSFAELVESFLHSDLPNPVGGITLFHNYGLSSHLVHQDGTAMQLIMERESRRQEQKALLTQAHAARLISDVLAFSALRCLVALRLRKLDLQAFHKYSASIEDLLRDFRSAYRAWEKSEYDPSTEGEPRA